MKKKMVEKDEIKEEIVENSKKVLSDFKKFISRGNVMDLAVGVIIGSAFQKIVSSIVNDILMPIIGAISGGVDFSGLSIQIGKSTIKYGAFIQNIIDFLIVAVCIFTIIKILEKFNRKSEKTEQVKEVKKDDQILLLEEIRDILKEKQEKIEIE